LARARDANGTILRVVIGKIFLMFLAVIGRFRLVAELRVNLGERV